LSFFEKILSKWAKSIAERELMLSMGQLVVGGVDKEPSDLSDRE
jgi:hypothetical protein